MKAYTIGTLKKFPAECAPSAGLNRPAKPLKSVDQKSNGAKHEHQIDYGDEGDEEEFERMMIYPLPPGQR